MLIFLSVCIFASNTDKNLKVEYIPVLILFGPKISQDVSPTEILLFGFSNCSTEYFKLRIHEAS